MVAVMRRALDLLGLALANEGHMWTEEERQAFDDADRLLTLEESSRGCGDPA